MKFYGQPNEFIVFVTPALRRLNRNGFRFDENGIYETNNNLLIRALKKKFKYEDDKLPLEEDKPPLNGTVEENRVVVEEENKQEVLEDVKEVKKSKKRG